MTRLPSKFRDLATVSADTWRLAVRAKGYLSERDGSSDAVEVERAFSREVGQSWTRPIRFLWIDGDHTYEGAADHPRRENRSRSGWAEQTALQYLATTRTTWPGQHWPPMESALEFQAANCP